MVPLELVGIGAFLSNIQIACVIVSLVYYMCSIGTYYTAKAIGRVGALVFLERARVVTMQHGTIMASMFGFVALQNLVGLIPVGVCLTAQLLVTVALSMMVFIASWLCGILLHGASFLRHFVPANIPVAMVPLLGCIELLSFNFRIVSLSVRLFANMFSGHVLTHILAEALSSMYSFLATQTIVATHVSSQLASIRMIGLILIIALAAVLTIIIILEVAIAILQAFVFVTLSALYINEVS